MYRMSERVWLYVAVLTIPPLAQPLMAAGLNLGPEQIIQAGGADILVPGYSVPSFADWNNDGRKDLLVGEGGGSANGKLRVYLNDGTSPIPHFSGSSYAKSNGADLVVTPNGCLGIFPRTVYWNADGGKDLLVGQGDGQIKIFLNTGTDAAPSFDGGTFLQVGQPGAKANISVGSRATPLFVDWNNDGRRDLVAGAYDSKIHLFLNEGTDNAPDFRVQTFAKLGGADLVVPGTRSSLVIMDLDGDGRKDILSGNTNGQILLYSNTGTDAAPAFSGYTAVNANGLPIDVDSSLRSRPFVCDFNSDSQLDLLVGYGDGKVRLYLGVPEPAALSLFLAGVLMLRPRRRVRQEHPPQPQACLSGL